MNLRPCRLTFRVHTHMSITMTITFEHFIGTVKHISTSSPDTTKKTLARTQQARSSPASQMPGRRRRGLACPTGKSLWRQRTPGHPRISWLTTPLLQCGRMRILQLSASTLGPPMVRHTSSMQRAGVTGPRTCPASCVRGVASILVR